MEKSQKKSNINIVPKAGAQIIEIREGAALPLKEPKKILIKGQIDAVSRFVSQRGNIDKALAVITVNRDIMAIQFEEKPNDVYSTEITGVLQLSKDYEKWGINTETTFNPSELADFIRMNRLAFEKREVANKLVSDLRNFTAKVEKEIKDADDKRGNTESLRRQVVNSNLPAGFKLKLPIFKGQQASIFNVEIEVDPRTLECYLVSPEAQELIDGTKNKIIDSEIDKLKGFCIIEQ